MRLYKITRTIKTVETYYVATAVVDTMEEFLRAAKRSGIVGSDPHESVSTVIGDDVEIITDAVEDVPILHREDFPA